MDEFEGSCGYFPKKRHFFWDTLYVQGYSLNVLFCLHREYKESVAAEAALGEEDRYPVVVIDDANHGQADMSAMFDVVLNAEL